MMPRTCIFRAAMAAACCLLLASCQYKELCYDHKHIGTVQVIFDWSLYPDAHPSGMTVLFYPAAPEAPTRADEETTAIRYDFSGHNGGSARLVEGQYQAVGYNNNTEAIRFRGMGSVATLEAFTRNSSITEGTKLFATKGEMPRAKGTEEEIVILEPDLLWGGAGLQFLVEVDGNHTTTVQPRELVREMVITIYNVPNLQYTSGLGASLTGLAGSVFLADGHMGEDHVTQAFEMRKIDETTIQARFNTFGHCPHADEGLENDHALVLYAVLADGTQWYFTTDVTEQLHDPDLNPEDTHHMEVDIEEDIPIPKPIVNGSGFQPTIDGWQGVEIEVGM